MSKQVRIYVLFLLMIFGIIPIQYVAAYTQKEGIKRYNLENPLDLTSSTPSASFTPSPTPTITGTISPTATITGTIYPTATSTTTLTPTGTIYPTITPSMTNTPSITGTISPTTTITGTIFPTAISTLTLTGTIFPTITPSMTVTNTPTATNTQTITPTSFFSCSSVIEIPKIECEALVSLYKNTNGDYWENNNNWLRTDAPCSWYGIECSDGNIVSVILENNQLNSIIPSELGSLTNLQSLELNGNQLSGSIPSELGGLIGLQILDLSNNQLTGNIPPELGNLTNLHSLKLNGNQLAGNIPPELGNLTNLYSLELNRNQLTGSIPSELNNLTGLQTLDLSNNQMSGNILSALSNLHNLQELDLYMNQLNGNIPSQFGTLNNLLILNLGNNQLSGSIPTELGNLTNLMILDLDHNKLTGDVPDSLTNLSYLIDPGEGGKYQGLTIDSNWLNVPNPYPSNPPTILDKFLEEKDPTWQATQAVVTTISTDGGIVSSDDGNATINIPAETVSQSTEFLYTPQNSPTEANGSFGFANLSFVFSALDADGNPINSYSLSQPITIYLHYSDSDVIYMDEGSLVLYYWNVSNSIWDDAAQTCSPVSSYHRDLVNNIISVDVCHLSEFAMLGKYIFYLPWIQK